MRIIFILKRRYKSKMHYCKQGLSPSPALKSQSCSLLVAAHTTTPSPPCCHWTINDAGTSSVTLKRSVHKAFHKNRSSYFSQHFRLWVLLSGDHISGFPALTKSLRTWHLVLLKSPCSLHWKWWHWRLNCSWWLNFWFQKLLKWNIWRCVCTEKTKTQI